MDDDEIALSILNAALGSAGYADNFLTHSAADALKALENHSNLFDCFLVDIRMPEMNGIQFVQKVRKIPKYEYTPILMITASSDKKDIDAAFMAGATDYISKPVDSIELATRLKLAREMDANRKELLAYRRKYAGHRDSEAVRRIPEFAATYLIDVNGFIEYDAFQNYISKLSRAELFRLCVASIRVNEFAENFSVLDGPEIEKSVKKIGLIISNVFRAQQKIFCYAGHGLFFCCYKGKVGDFDSRTLEGIKKSVDFEFSDYLGPIDISCGAVRRVGLTQSEDPLQFFRFEHSSMARQTETYLSSMGQQIDGTEGLRSKNENKSKTSSFGVAPDVTTLIPRFISILANNILFLEKCSQKLEAAPLSREEMESVISLSHKIAGVASMIGFPALGLAARSLEEMANKDRGSNANASINLEVKIRIESFLDEIENVLVENI